jgi:KUP system potassium uptake protein
MCLCDLPQRSYMFSYQVLVFLCVKSVPEPHVQPEERFLVGRIGLKQYRLYRVVVRYGYRDVQPDALEFEKALVSCIAEFIRSGGCDKNGHPEGADSPYEMLSIVSEGLAFQEEVDGSSESSAPKENTKSDKLPSKSKRVRFVLPENAQVDREVRAELQELTEARGAGMSFIMGRSHMKAKSGSSLIKRIAINLVYEFLMRNSRGPAYAANVPHVSTIEVGMVCQI